MKHNPSLIENIAEKLGIIDDLRIEESHPIPHMTEPGDLSHYPPPEKWDD